MESWKNGMLVICTLYSLLSRSGVQAGKYCWYTDDDSNSVKMKYCGHGCCRTNVDDGAICCFSWSIGIILGVALGTLAVIAGIATLIVCCVMASKTRGRVGSVMDQSNNTAVYPGGTSAIHSFSYPHPPSAFYPGSKFPSTPPYSDVAYPQPTQYGTPPSYTVAMGNPSSG